ncbi:thiamine-phosphate kinase [Vulgatibacter incomptus]|uniref:Thiamine-monophosphate kinase n=1 Tax=Vulgatibacter incomptus TaxID=1391653 RepID=A0A0K1PIV8_9BACT|nr:thiamine-phosphate kinase [Vulgatibacter incomptus]AKU93044.1 Thiamine-monophosphate kinase [Vulgatibacter incomptus]
MTGEFERISLFTAPFEKGGGGVVAGPGDDCALTRPRPGWLLVSKVDELVEDVHFSAAFRPEEVGHKALAVALSDLAAAGATPRWFLVALGLPPGFPDRRLAGLAKGMSALASRTGAILVGGNLTRAGALSLTVTALGEAREGEALRRSGARPGYELLVSGSLGGAALGLRLLSKDGGSRRSWRRSWRRSAAVRSQLTPEPRVGLGTIAGRYAAAGIDLSDGLLQDLGHLCERSAVGAELYEENLPLSPEVKRLGAEGLELALGGGEDYELLFAVAPERVAPFVRAAKRRGESLTRIGRIVEGRGIRLLGKGGAPLPLPASAGWDHFR